MEILPAILEGGLKTPMGLLLGMGTRLMHSFPFSVGHELIVAACLGKANERLCG